MDKILVIDDDDVLRSMIVTTLNDEGFDTLEAEGGESGIKLAKSQLPDLIICDVTMSAMDGYATLENLRNEQSTAAIPVILMTGEATEAGMRKGMKLGADDYLPKPFSGSELLVVVNARLKKKETLRREAERKLEDLRTNISLAMPHELLTPLSGILGFSEILSNEYKNLQPAEVGDMARNIHESAKRLHRLIENFLIYAQLDIISSDEKKMESLRRNTTEAVGTLIEAEAREKAKQVGRPNDLILDVKEATVGISREYLTKIFDELLDNSFNFSDPGTPVSISTSVNHESMTVTINDRGRGITPDQIVDIGAYIQFERKMYEQQGSGLGLTIARRLTELHGGKLSIRSDVESGTTVTVRLPKGQTISS